MKKIIYTISSLLLALNIVNAQVLPVVAPEQDNPVILAGGNIHTGTGEVIKGGDIAFKDGIITAVGSLDGLSDMADYERIDVSGKEIYPGLIFVNTTLGLVEISGVDVTVDSREYGQINPGARSAVAYNTDSHVIPVVRSNGILLAQVVPTGGILSGTSSIMQLDAWNWEDAIYKPDEGVHLNWPRISAPRGRRAMYARFMGGGSRSSYQENFKELTDLFMDAAAYAEIEKPEKTNQHLEAIKGLFDGSQTLYIHTSEAKGIIASVNFAREQGIKRIVLVGANEQAWMVKDFIKENNIPVILAHIHSMPDYEHSDVRMPYKLAKMFSDEGIVTGITYSNQAYGYNLPFVAGQTVPYGVDKEEALAMVTLNNAKILGIDKRTGSLEKGKDANIVVSDGDILDMLGNDVVLAFINGRFIDLDNKHKMLYRRFQEKYKR
ncbi:MAG TPA: amidohydrolase [Bacteroidetes bacterium]|nr:amidohydrolase [Bacteroidota bacterium]